MITLENILTDFDARRDEAVLIAGASLSSCLALVNVDNELVFNTDKMISYYREHRVLHIAHYKTYPVVLKIEPTMITFKNVPPSFTSWYAQTDYNQRIEIPTDRYPRYMLTARSWVKTLNPREFSVTRISGTPYTDMCENIIDMMTRHHKSALTCAKKETTSRIRVEEAVNRNNTELERYRTNVNTNTN
jgi:hypothetical protein